MILPSTKTLIRLSCVLALGTTTAACNSNKANDAVRNGPQAVHPSTSALAQGVVTDYAPTAGNVTYVAIDAPVPQETYVAGFGVNDGSQPIFP